MQAAQLQGLVTLVPEHEKHEHYRDIYRVLDQKAENKVKAESRALKRGIRERRHQSPKQCKTDKNLKTTAAIQLEIIANGINPQNQIKKNVQTLRKDYLEKYSYETKVAEDDFISSDDESALDMALYEYHDCSSNASESPSRMSHSSESTIKSSQDEDNEEVEENEDRLLDLFAKQLQLEQDKRFKAEVRQEEEAIVKYILALEQDRDAKVKEIVKLQQENRRNEARSLRRQHASRAYQQKQLARQAWHKSDDEDSDDSSLSSSSSSSNENDSDESYSTYSYSGSTLKRNRQLIKRLATTSSLISGQSSSSERRERRMRAYEEELRAREEEELAETRVRFKARPVPVSTLLPKYNEIRELAEARSLARKLDRQARLEDQQCPFSALDKRTNSWIERQKKETKLAKGENRPCKNSMCNQDQDFFDMHKTQKKTINLNDAHLSFTERQQKEDRERRARCDRRAQQLLRESRLPRRMEFHDMYNGKTASARRTTYDNTCTFQPNVNTRVPDFEASKDRWVKTLANARRKQKPTQPDVSGLSMFSDEAKTREDLRKARTAARLAAEEESNARDKRKMENLVKRVQSQATRRPTTVNMTKSQELRLRQCAETKAAEQAKRQREEARRKLQAERLRERSKVIRAMVNEAEETRRQSSAGYTSLEDAARKAKERAEQDKLAWKQRRRELRDKMSNPRPDRPALIERNGEAKRLQDRKQAALARVAATLHNVDQEDSHNALTQDELDLVKETIINDQLVNDYLA